MKECYTLRDWFFKITEGKQYDNIFINKAGDQAQLKETADIFNFLNGLELVAPVSLVDNQVKEDYQGKFNIYKFNVYVKNKTKEVIITIVNYNKH